MKRSVCLLMIGAFVLGVSGCSYHVTWGKMASRYQSHLIKKQVQPKKAQKCLVKVVLLSVIRKKNSNSSQLICWHPMSKGVIPRKKALRELRHSMLNGKKIRLAQQLNMLTKLSQLSRLKEQAISSSIFARLNMLRGL